MSIINTDKAFINAEKLKEKISSKEVIIDSLSILKPEPTNWIRKIFFLIIEIVIAYVMVKQSHAISMTKEIIQVIISIIIALIAISFTGYAFFQALINKKLLIAMLSIDSDNKRKGNLINTNRYFAEIMSFQIICVLLDLLVIIITIILPDEWYLFASACFNNLLAVIAIALVLYCNIEGICEMPSFIFNVYQLFNLYAYSRMMEIKDDDQIVEEK